MINSIYSPVPDRYDSNMKYRRCGKSGILLPEISLGLWHNFGDVNAFSNSLAMAHYASTEVLPISTLPTTMVLPAVRLKKHSA